MHPDRGLGPSGGAVLHEWVPTGRPCPLCPIMILVRFRLFPCPLQPPSYPRLSEPSARKLLDACPTTPARRRLFDDACPTTPASRRLIHDACSTTPAPRRLLNDVCSTTPDQQRLLIDACSTTPAQRRLHTADQQLAFRSAQSLLALKKDHIRRILHLPPPSAPAADQQKDPASTAAAQELEQHVSTYLRRTVDTFDLTKSIDEVCSQIWATLYDYPSLKACTGLLQYVRDSMRLAWALVNQNPTYVLEYEQRHFRRDVHVRFHSSNPDSEAIRTYLWPALLEGAGGPCVHKAVVLT